MNNGARKRICAITGSRADWGLLKPVLQSIQAHSHFELQLLATGGHLSEQQGYTLTDIKADGFEPDHGLALELDDDSAGGICQSLGQAVAGFGKTFQKLQPDLILLLGDRYEIFAAVQAALISKIPVAHIAGGDVSEGAYDDAMRHAITKMSHIHFVTNQDAKDRVMQLGENPKDIYLCGSPGIDNIVNTPSLSQSELEKLIGMPLRERNFAITFHSATLDAEAAENQISPLLSVLEKYSNTTLVFTGANADTDGQIINTKIQGFVSRHDNACFHQSLGAQGYYSLARVADLVIGNSSSGLYEAPSLMTQSINIGSRQQGRLTGNSVIHCDNQSDAIAKAIEAGLTQTLDTFDTPYGDGTASQCIVNALDSYSDFSHLLIKHFHRTDLSDKG